MLSQFCTIFLVAQASSVLLSVVFGVVYMYVYYYRTYIVVWIQGDVAAGSCLQPRKILGEQKNGHNEPQKKGRKGGQIEVQEMSFQKF